MKNFIFLLIIAASCASSAKSYRLDSGQKCKFSVDRIDKFTKDRHIRTSLFKRLSNGSQMVVGAIGNTKYLSLKLHSNEVWSINKGESIEMLLKNGDIVTLKSNQYVLANYKKEVVFGDWSEDIVMQLSEENFHALMENEIETIRIHLTKKFKDIDTKSRSRNLMDQCACLENELKMS